MSEPLNIYKYVNMLFLCNLVSNTILTIIVSQKDGKMPQSKITMVDNRQVSQLSISGLLLFTEQQICDLVSLRKLAAG